MFLKKTICNKKIKNFNEHGLFKDYPNNLKINFRKHLKIIELK